MKHILAVLALFLFVNVFSQADHSITVIDINTYGYINGHRLDSIDATYAEFDLTISNRVQFDYGQDRMNRKEYIVTDIDRKPLSFPNNSPAFLLNFFHYNRWDLACHDETRWVIKKL